MLYGVTKEYGTLERCRAKPENVGKYRCHHVDHHDLEESPTLIQRYNEEQMEKHFDCLKSKVQQSEKSITKISQNVIFSHVDGVSVDAREMSEMSSEMGEAFPKKEFAFIRDFSDDAERIVGGKSIKNAKSRMYEYLQSDRPTAIKTREFLGEEVDLEEFATIIAVSPRSMCSSTGWKNSASSGAPSLTRTVMTGVQNDMNRKRYAASVLFFGGRCCYCNCVMRKKPGSTQASGEHLTPVSPESQKDPRGATRYGNMALACVGCNQERGNKEMHQWLSETRRFPAEQKQAAVERIEAFREFALYRDYTEQENKEITKTINRLQRFQESFTKDSETKRFSDEDDKKIRDRIKIEIHNLRQKLQDA